MEYWKDQSEPIKAFVKLFETAMKDPDLGKAMEGVNQLIWFDYTQDGPDCSFWLCAKPGELATGPGKPKDVPDMVMSLSADDAHRSWSNKLNPIQALARKKIIVKGSATGLLKLAPKLPQVAKIYAQVLKDLGWENKIMK